MSPTEVMAMAEAVVDNEDTFNVGGGEAFKGGINVRW